MVCFLAIFTALLTEIHGRVPQCLQLKRLKLGMANADSLMVQMDKCQDNKISYVWIS